MKVKKLIATTALVTAASLANAQTPMPIEIDYDAAGNRISRKTLAIPLGAKGGNSSDSTYYVDQMQTIQMKVYPNPTQGKVYIEMSGTGETELNRIRVYDNQGRKIHENEGLGCQMEVDLTSYPTGYYIVELFAKDEHTTWKILKK